MAISEKLRFILEADVDDAVKGFEKVGKAADEKLGSAESRIDKIGVNMTRAGAAMLAAGGLAAAGLVKAAQKAGDLSEAVNLTQITFGDAADEIDAFARTSATSLGQSERAAREATAQFGGLLQNLGYTNDQAADTSITLTRLASDLGSAFNKEPAEAVAALGSALRGETEPIRAFNVMLSDAAVRTKAVEMGLAATTAEVDANAKAQATLALIMEQTNRYQGDFANTADSAANAQRVLNAQWEDTQAQLGAAVLPIMQDVLGVANDMVTGFNNLNTATGGAVTTVATWGTGLLLVGGTISTVTGKVLQMRDGIKALTTRFGTSNVAAAGFGAALAGVFTYALVTRMGQVNERLREFGAAADAITSGSTDAEDALAELVRTNGRFEQLVRETNISLADLAGMLTDANMSGDEFRDTMFRMADAAGAADHEALRVANTANELHRQFREARQAADTLNGALDRTTGIVRPLADDARFAGDEFGYLGEKVDESAEAADDATNAYDLLRAALDKTEAIDNAQEAIEEAFLAMFTGAEGARGEVLEAIAAVSVLAQTVGVLDDHPIVVDIAVAVEQGDLDRALRKARELQAIANVLAGRSSPGSLYTPPPVPVPPRAAGGPVAAGMTYLVGERGPELVTMGASGYVTPNHAMGGGGAINVTVNAGMGANGAEVGRQVVEAIRQYERRNGPGWRS